MFGILLLVRSKIIQFQNVAQTSLAYFKFWTKSNLLKMFKHVIDIYYQISLQDLESKEMVEELKPEIINQAQNSKADPPQCLSLAWSTDGQTLFAGYSDNIIRVWQVSVSAR